MHNPPCCWHFPAQPVWTHRAMEAPLGLSDKEMSHPLIYPAVLLLLPLNPLSSRSTRPYVYIQLMADCMNSSDRVARRWHLTFSCPSKLLIHLALGTHSSPGFIHLLMSSPTPQPLLCSCNITRGSPFPLSILTCEHWMAQASPLPPPCFSRALTSSDSPSCFPAHAHTHTHYTIHPSH